MLAHAALAKVVVALPTAVQHRVPWERAAALRAGVPVKGPAKAAEKQRSHNTATTTTTTTARKNRDPLDNDTMKTTQVFQSNSKKLDPDALEALHELETVTREF